MRILALDFGSARTPGKRAIMDPTSGRYYRSVIGDLSMAEQARATEAFVEILRERLAVPVETEDERFTTDLAQQSGGIAPEDAVAAAYLLQGWLDRER